MNKLISIITPTFNSVDKLETCILSIKNQTYKNIEHIIIDGGSSDSTIDLIRKYEKEYNIKWLSEKDNGVADAMNKGFEMASGEFFGWIDADNYYNPDIIESIIKNFETTPSINIIYGNVDIVDVDKKVSSYSPPEHISFEKALIYTTGAIPVQPAVFFKREVFEKAKGFDSKYKIAGDFDFWLKVLKKEKNIYYLQDTKYKPYDGNIHDIY